MSNSLKIEQVHDFNRFFVEKQEEILAIAQRNTEDIVKKETALMNFEIMVGLDFSKKEREALTKETRNQRLNTWNNLVSKSKGKNMSKVLDSF